MAVAVAAATLEGQQLSRMCQVHLRRMVFFIIIIQPALGKFTIGEVSIDDASSKS